MGLLCAGIDPGRAGPKENSPRVLPSLDSDGVVRPRRDEDARAQNDNNRVNMGIPTNLTQNDRPGREAGADPGGVRVPLVLQPLDPGALELRLPRPVPVVW